MSSAATDALDKSHDEQNYIVGYQVKIIVDRDIEEFRAVITLGSEEHNVTSETKTDLMHNVERVITEYCKNLYEYDMEYIQI